MIPVYPWSDQEVVTCDLICAILVKLSSASTCKSPRKDAALGPQCQGEIECEQEANKECASMNYSVTFEQPCRMADPHVV